MLLWLLTLKVAMAMVLPNAATRHVHFNNAGDSPSPPEVTNAVLKHMTLESQLGGYRAAELVSADGVYASAARLIGAGPNRRNDDDDDAEVIVGAEKYDARNEIALVESATVAWTRFFYAALETKEREPSPSPPDRAEIEVTTGGAAKKEERIVLVSEAEYAANLVAAVKFARDRGREGRSSRFRWRVFPIPSSTVDDGDDGGEPVSTGMVDLEAFESILRGTYPIGDGDGGERYLDAASIAMVCITHIPTNSGIINPVNEIGDMIHRFNSGRAQVKPDGTTALPQILYLVDACQSVGQISVNSADMRCHALAATGRKYLRGPRGTGFLYVQRRIADALEPSHVDHAAAPVANVPERSTRGARGLEEDDGFGLRHSYKPGAARFEFWEASAATRLGLGAAMDASLAVGMDVIEEKCASLGGLLRRRLRSMEGVRVYHDATSACGIVTFYLERVDAIEMKEILQNESRGESVGDPGQSSCCFHLSTVPATSTPLDSSRTGIGERTLLRASLSYFNTEDEIEMFCKVLEDSCQML